jgi:hypothetical protein
MNLCSCDGCGVVLDKDKLNFPTEGYSEEGIDLNNAFYDRNTKDFRFFISCPVCNNKIFGDIVL